jgi:vitamin B12 transporter
MPFFYQTTLTQTRAKPTFLAQVLLTLLLLSGSGALWAQPSDETITVTASRLPMDSLRSGSQITIISKADIDLRNPNSLPDLLRGQPGLSVSQQSGLGGLTQVRMRGREANHVLVLVDGVEANDIGQGSEFNFSQFPVRQIERIEIVHGAESAIWGSDAIAGVIHIMTRSPESQPSTTFLLSAGSNQTQNLAIDSATRLGETQLAFGISHFKTQGYNVSRQGDERDGSHQRAAYLRTSSPVSEHWRLGSVFRLQQSQNDFDDVDYALTGLPTDADFTTAHQNWIAGVRMVSDHEDLQQSLSFNFSRDKNDNRTTPNADTQTDSAKHQVNYQISKTINTGTWIGLMEYESLHFEQRGPSSFFGDPNQDHSLTQLALGGEYRLDQDNWTGSLSARLEQNSDFGAGHSLRGNAAYFLTEATKIFGAIGRSTKNPTFTERFGYYTNFKGNDALKPEHSLALDFGISHRFSALPITMALQGYAARLENEINGFVYDPVDFVFTANNDPRRSKQRGYDAKINWQASDALTVEAFYGRLKATDGDSLDELRRPRTTGFFAIAYRAENWQHQLSAAYTGKSEDIFFPPVAPFQERVQMDSFTLVSVTSNVLISKKFEAFVAIENLLDTQFEEVFGYQRSGRTARLGLKLRIE